MYLYSLPEYQKDLERVAESLQLLDKLEGKTILVTGASGMIGSFLFDLFLFCRENKGLSIRLYGTGRNLERLRERFCYTRDWENIKFFKYELGYSFLWESKIEYRPDILIHCAGSGSPAEFMKEPGKMIRDTVTGAYDLLEYVRRSGIHNCIYISSGEVYGKAALGTTAFLEHDSGQLDQLQSRSCYPVAKRTAEAVWASYNGSMNIKTTIARLCHTYGPTAKPEESRIAGQCIAKVAEGMDIVLKSRGEQTRSWCYVADCVSGILTVLLKGKGGEAYNVAPRDTAKISELAGLAAAMAGKRVLFDLPSQEEIQKFNPMDMAVLNSEKLRSLGWKEYYTLEQGLKQTYRIMKHLAYDS